MVIQHDRQGVPVLDMDHLAIQLPRLCCKGLIWGIKAIVIGIKRVLNIKLCLCSDRVERGLFHCMWRSHTDFTHDFQLLPVDGEVAQRPRHLTRSECKPAILNPAVEALTYDGSCALNIAGLQFEMVSW